MAGRLFKYLRSVSIHSVAENARGIQSLNDGAADGAAIFPLLRPVLTG